MPITKEKLGENLKAVRESRRMTQLDLAYAVDLNRPTYARYEQGQNEIAATKLTEIAAKLRVPTALLLGEATTATAARGEFLDWYESLTDAEKERVHRVARAALE